MDHTVSNEEIIIPTSYITTLLKEVNERGYDAERLLEEAGIERRELEDQRFFSAARYGRLYQLAIGAMQDEWFGMLSGGKIRKGTFRLLSLLMVHCKTLRQALLRAWEFCQVCRGFRVSIRMEELDDRVRVYLAPLDNVSEAEFADIIASARPVMLRTTVATWQHYWSWLIGTEIPIERAFFTFAEPEQQWEMAEFTSSELVFGHEINGMEFSTRYLDYSVIQTEETLEEFLRRAPFGLVVSADSGHSTKARVKAMLNQNLGDPILSTDNVAKRLNMSVTTLRRHLQVEGTSFQRLKDECRLEAAFHYLGCPDLSNREIADRLGFDEVSVFFRAFKKWTGLTPGQYRADLEAGPADSGNAINS